MCLKYLSEKDLDDDDLDDDDEKEVIEVAKKKGTKKETK